MALHIVTADERLAEANSKTTMVIVGPSGAGKTSLLRTVSPAATLCLDFEAGLKSVQDWRGDSIPIRTFTDALDIACLIGGVNPAASPEQPFSEAHYRHVTQVYAELVQMIASKRLIFVDSITDLIRTVRPRVALVGPELVDRPKFQPLGQCCQRGRRGVHQRPQLRTCELRTWTPSAHPRCAGPESEKAAKLAAFGRSVRT